MAAALAATIAVATLVAAVASATWCLFFTASVWFAFATRRLVLGAGAAGGFRFSALRSALVGIATVSTTESASRHEDEPRSQKKWNNTGEMRTHTGSVNQAGAKISIWDGMQLAF